MRKIKILYIIDKMDVGGAQRHLLEVIRALNKDIFDPYCCCLVRRGELAHELENAGIPVKVFSIKRIYGYSGIRDTVRLYRFIRQNNFDIVHSYLFLATLSGNIAAFFAKVPVILSARRDTGVPNEGGWRHHCAYRIAHALAKRVICVSNAVKEVVKDKEGVPEEKITVIQNGVDCAKLVFGNIPRESLGFQQDDFIVNMTASFSWVKNHILLLEAAKEVIKIDRRVKFLLVGDGELKAALKDKAKSMGISNNVLFLGKRSDSLGLTALSDIAVNLSFSEGSPNAVLEAMALGKPVIVTAVPGNIELVDCAGFARIVPLGGSEKLAEAILDLVASRKNLKLMGAEAKNRAQRYFSLADKVAEFESLYRGFFPRFAKEANEKKLNVLFLLTDSLRIAGAQKNVVALAGYLAASGHTVSIACKKGELSEELAKKRVACIDIDLHYRTNDQFERAVASLKKIVAAGGINLIAPQSLRTALVAKKAVAGLTDTKKPAIVTTIFNVGSKLYAFFAGWILNKTSDFVLFESHYERNRLLKKGMSALKSDVIHTGIDLERFLPLQKDTVLAERFGYADGQMVVGTVARLSPEKDIKTLIRSFFLLRKKDNKAELLIVGDGALRGELEKLVDKLRLRDCVTFAGQQYDTRGFISLFDIFVLSSVREAFSLAAREAMAMAKPVVLTKVGGAQEMVSHGSNGLLVDASSPVALKEAIELLAHEPALKKSMGARARETAQELFDQKKWFKETEGIYLRFAYA